MELREKAKKWLDAYKRGDPNGVDFEIEDVAAVVAEYLHGTEETSAKKKALEDRVELLHEDLMAEQGKRRKLEEALRETEEALGLMDSQLTEARGKISAYEFVIRCNGVSGGEVRVH